MKPNLIVPMLVCRDAAAEVEFCRVVFGAEEVSRSEAEDGSVRHATLMLFQSLIMVHDVTSQLASQAPRPDGSSSVVIYLYLNEVDPVIERAVSHGARVLVPAKDQAWGDRVGRIIDPQGHVWNIASRIAEE